MSMINETSRRRVTYGQLENLWEFLNKHKDLATDYNKSSHAREFSRRMWEEIALALNSHGSGAVKDWKGWCKYWNDYKAKLKKLAAAYASAQHVTGGGQSTSKAPTDIERKFLHILGNDFGSGLPGIRVEAFVEVQTETPVCTNTITSMVITPNSESILTDFDMIFPSEHSVVRTEPSSRLMSPPIPSTSPMPASPLQHSQPLVVTPRRSPRRRNPSALNSPINPSHAQPTSILQRRDERLCSTFAARRQLIPSSQPRSATLTSPPTNEPSTTAAPTIRRLSPTPALAQPTPATEPRRRRLRREPTLSAGTARRILIAESQRQTQIEEEKLESWRILIAEMRDLKDLFRQRITRSPTGGE